MGLFATFCFIVIYCLTLNYIFPEPFVVLIFYMSFFKYWPIYLVVFLTGSAILGGIMLWQWIGELYTSLKK